MFKKIFQFLLFLFLIIFSIIITVKMSKETRKINNLLKNPDQISFIKDKIKNKVNFKDDLIDIEINNVLALRKTVRIYQWVENKKLMNKTGTYIYTYQKDWVNNFIDSKIFHDKTKNNYQKNARVYKSEIIFPDSIITKKDNYELDQVYFEDKIKLKKLEFKNTDVVFRGAPIKKSYNIKYEEEESYKDLDSYVAAEERKIAKNDTDRFQVIDRTTLFNGNDYSNPEIGDVKITYEIFSPDYISFFGKIEDNRLIPYGDFIEVNFNDSDKAKLIKKYKIIFVIKLAIFSTVAYLILYFLIGFIQNNIKNVILNLIPYFNEYLVFGNKNTIVLLFFFFLFPLAIRLYFFSIIPLIVLYFLRQIDYYSI